MGFRKPQVVAQMAPYGFDQFALDEGWTLLRGVVGDRLGVGPLTPGDDLLAQLDAWENLWFPVAGAVLRRHAPEIYSKVFHNLTQTQGPEVVLSVDTFLTRLDELATDPGAGAAALVVLQRHGLTDAVLAEARGLIAQTTRVSGVLETEEESPDDLLRREAEMWDYYLQWSAIARVAIRDRRLLRSLGFLKLRRNDNGTGEDDLQPDVPDDNDDSDLAQFAGDLADEPESELAADLDGSATADLARAG